MIVFSSSSWAFAQSASSSRAQPSTSCYDNSWWREVSLCAAKFGTEWEWRGEEGGEETVDRQRKSESAKNNVVNWWWTLLLHLFSFFFLQEDLAESRYLSPAFLLQPLWNQCLKLVRHGDTHLHALLWLKCCSALDVLDVPTSSPLLPVQSSPTLCMYIHAVQHAAVNNVQWLYLY